MIWLTWIHFYSISRHQNLYLDYPRDNINWWLYLHDFYNFLPRRMTWNFRGPIWRFPPTSWEEDFFGVTRLRHLGQHIGQGIALPLSTSRFGQFLAIFAWIIRTYFKAYNHNSMLNYIIFYESQGALCERPTVDMSLISGRYVAN